MATSFSVFFFEVVLWIAVVNELRSIERDLENLSSSVIPLTESLLISDRWMSLFSQTLSDLKHSMEYGKKNSQTSIIFCSELANLYFVDDDLLGVTLLVTLGEI